MNAPSGLEAGLFASLKRLAATALEIGQVRLELLGVEGEFEKRRIFDGLLWGAAALICLTLGLVLLSGFIILLLWEGYRLAAMGALACLFISVSALLMHFARNRLRSPNGLFATSVAELRRDCAELQTPPKK